MNSILKLGTILGPLALIAVAAYVATQHGINPEATIAGLAGLTGLAHAGKEAT